ncbi:hypothetical protein AB0P21_32275 [Kribbella sp. NPDC056861]|uniref:hypothetical protein n=1 Tax=Kribbella sp. NPDC056861 TaxID=3154857 RepID=UPI0034121A8F
MTTVRRVLAVLAIALALAGIWLVFDNPDIHGTSRADDYTCLAPYDTVLNKANNFPGGEPPPDGEDIAHRCRQAGKDRFALAVGSASAAAVAGVALLTLRRRQHSLTADRQSSGG